jgi:preprotein translocase subunit SecD
MSIKDSKTSNRNKHKIGASTGERGVSTSKVSTHKQRIDIRIPENSKIYQYLYVDNISDNKAKWEQLDAILERAERNKDELTIKILDDFINRMGVFYPDKIEALEKLRPLIIRRILKGLPLDEAYYQDLKRL